MHPVTTEPARTPDLPADQDHAARIEHQDEVHVLVLTSGVRFERVRDEVRALFAPGGPHAALRGESIRLDLGDRDIVLFDLRRLTTLLLEEADVHVGGLVCGPEALHRYAEKQLKMRVHLSDGSAPLSDQDAAAAEHPADPDGAVEAPSPEPGEAAAVAAPDEASASEADSDDASASATDPDEASAEAAQAESDAASTGGADSDEASASAGAPADEASASAHGPADEASASADGPADETSASVAASADAPEPEARSSAVVLADPDRVSAMPEGGRRTVSVHRSLRSGAQVRFPGDIVVFGDVNAGAEVVADGSIVVLGSLRGMAHAGAHGDPSATVMAFNFTPTNLRIAQRQAIDLPTEAAPRPRLLSLLRAPGLADRGAPRGATARVARVVDGAVVVEDYAARAPR